jgi:hypothetical protein
MIYPYPINSPDPRVRHAEPGEVREFEVDEDNPIDGNFWAPATAEEATTWGAQQDVDVDPTPTGASAPIPSSTDAGAALDAGESDAADDAAEPKE